MPVADLDVARLGVAGAGLEKRLQAHQERRPLGAAVVHEVARLLPALVVEADDREVVLRRKIEADLRAKTAKNQAYELSQKFDDARQAGEGNVPVSSPGRSMPVLCPIP